MPCEDSHVSNCARSAGCNLIATLVFGMREIMAINEQSVKLFKGHNTSSAPRPGAFCALNVVCSLTMVSMSIENLLGSLNENQRAATTFSGTQALHATPRASNQGLA